MPDRPPEPRQWILSAGQPEAVLQARAARRMPDRLPGFWHTRLVARIYLVIVRELPETLLLRLFGRGVVNC